MEKRTILAFVLCIIVLIGWSYLFQPKEPPKEPGIEDTGQQDQRPEPSPAKPSVPSPKIPLKLDQQEVKPTPLDIDEKEIRVETPLYIATFSNRGPTLKSFQLKKYRLTKEPNSPFIELVKLSNNETGFIDFGFGNPSAKWNTKNICEVNRDTILLESNSSPMDLTFHLQRADGVSIDQTFRFYPDIYPIDMQVTVSNNASNQVEGNILASVKNLPPKDKISYYAFNGIALLLNDELEEIKPKKMKEEKSLSGKIDWMAYEDGYFISAIIPKNQGGGSFNGRILPSGTIEATYYEPSIALRPLEKASSTFTLLFGPRDIDILKQAESKLEKAINFGFFDIIAKPLHYALRFFYQYVKNYGVAIIILTILVRIVFWPLTHKSYKSMKQMQKIQPLMAKIREKHKNNREQMQRELMGLYKTYKINPLGGCLPMVIQIPVFFALFRILGNSIELRHAPFMLWITDLSAPDRLLNFPFNIPFMAPPSGIPVLTLLMGASMFIQQKMTPTPGDPAQAKMMMFLPIIFTVMFINFPSGLVLYWFVSNILSIGQQYRIKRKPG